MPDREVDREIRIELDGQNINGSIEWTLNGVADGTEPLFTFDAGETVHITFVNRAGPEHPFHLHGQFFEIVDGGTMQSAPPGLKDTVLIPGQSTVEVIAYMDNPGMWMAHCHILEHAALGMMSHFLVR
jgi:FtsP/CotA-like multicopper oxidase with cupredoxin domain